MERRSRSYQKPKPSVVVEWSLSCADRRTLRRAIAEKWSDEDPHTNYRYNVEKWVSGKRVYRNMKRRRCGRDLAQPDLCDVARS